MAMYLNVVHWYSNEQVNAVAINCKCQRLQSQVTQKLKQKSEMEAGHRNSSNSTRPQPACECTHWDSEVENFSPKVGLFWGFSPKSGRVFL